MATYPASPPPHRIQGESLSYPSLSLDYDEVVTHVRTLFGFPIRRLQLHYVGISEAEFESLRQFFDARKGRNERFTFTHPVSSASYQARFAEDALKWSIRGPQEYDLVVDIEEAP